MTAENLLPATELLPEGAVMSYDRPTGETVTVYLRSPEPQPTGISLLQDVSPAAPRPMPPQAEAPNRSWRQARMTRVLLWAGSRAVVLGLGAGVAWTGGNTALDHVPLIGSHLSWAPERYVSPTSPANAWHDVEATISGAKKALLIDRGGSHE